MVQSGDFPFRRSPETFPSGAVRRLSLQVQSGDFPFILVTTPAAKLDPVARRQLRSHVMKGKNKKKVKMSGSSVLGSWINDQQHDSLGLSRVASSPIFPRVGTVMSHIPFVEDMNPNKWELIYKCM